MSSGHKRWLGTEDNVQAKEERRTRGRQVISNSSGQTTYSLRKRKHERASESKSSLGAQGNLRPEKEGEIRECHAESVAGAECNILAEEQECIRVQVMSGSI